MANGDKTILYVDKVELDKYTADGQRIFNVAVYKNTNTSGAISFNSILTTETYDNGDGTVGTHVSMFNTANISLDTIETINNKQYYKINAYIYIDQYEGYTYTKGQQLFFGICADTMANEIFTSENNFEQTVVEFDYDLNKVTPDYLLWDVTDSVESLKVSYTEPPHKIISEIQYPDETIYDIKDKNALNKSQITNCLLEVPQRIKLELNNGVLTLKAGSEVIVPNGFESDGTTPKFDYVTIESDISTSTVSSTPAQRFSLIDTDNMNFVNTTTQYSLSGNTSTMNSTTANTFSTFYNTETNMFYRGNGSSWDVRKWSLPIALITNEPNVISSIDQVFNGMGYIGSTVWVDKGVKGLIPNGRNKDGSLNNIEYVIPSIITRTLTNNGSIEIAISYGGALLVYHYFTLSDENYLVGNNGAKVIGVSIASVYIKNNVITSFNPKQPFRAVDYNDKSEISGWSMPSDKYIDLTLGKSGSTYAAPANGYYFIDKTKGVSQGGVTVVAEFGNYSSCPALTTDRCSIIFPVRKGDTININYTATGSTNVFRFIYAEGSK